MGGEFGQWLEWNEARQLDWEVAGMDKHAGLFNLICDLNKTYREQPALHAFDFDAEGFQWLSCDDVENSVLAFLRRSHEESVICVFNFTPRPLQDYVIGIPETGSYQVIFNSDASWYGGSNAGNSFEIISRPQAEHNFDYSLTITVPPLAAVFIKKVAS